MTKDEEYEARKSEYDFFKDGNYEDFCKRVAKELNL